MQGIFLIIIQKFYVKKILIKNTNFFIILILFAFKCHKNTLNRIQFIFVCLYRTTKYSDKIVQFKN